MPVRKFRPAALFSMFLPGVLPFLIAADSGPGHLARYADPARIWGPGIEGVIEEAHRLCFKTYIVGDRVMNLRIPFAQNGERDTLSGQGWTFLGGGKSGPAGLWPAIGEILESEDFKRYTGVLSGPGEKVITFDIPRRSWTVSRDIFDIGRMKVGSYGGLPHRPNALVSGGGVREADVYNYLYCVGWTGMDCSGYVWHVLSHIARTGGVDLGRALGRFPDLPRGSDPARYAGTWFFGSNHAGLEAVPDRISGLRPADILLFRGSGGAVVHSAVIQSVDLSSGLIRYLQSTDEAPQDERGVHDSFIHFDPRRDKTLMDGGLIWTQSRCPPFPGEAALPFSGDGERYRAFGGGRVVRLKALAPALNRIRRR
ncbi:MAG: peptidoglycan endopeptidase [Treponema sp.]|nr:peptidoglycan endopeptidase [Treponema sp.]